MPWTICRHAFHRLLPPLLPCRLFSLVDLLFSLADLLLCDDDVLCLVSTVGSVVPRSLVLFSSLPAVAGLCDRDLPNLLSLLMSILKLTGTRFTLVPNLLSAPTNERALPATSSLGLL